MPYKIRKLPNKNLYKVVDIETGEIMSKGTSLENAEKQVKFLYAIKNKKFKPNKKS